MVVRFTNLLELEALARDAMPKEAFDYYAGGAEDEVSLARNREAFNRWALRPRVLVDVSTRDLTATVLGRTVSMPVLVAPTAFHALAHPDGEVATSRAAAEAGTILVASSISTRTLEDIAAVGPARRWFQLYVARHRGFTEKLVRRAERSGYEALCVTVDTPLLGRRERDERNAFVLPEGLTMPNFAELRLDRMSATPEGGSAFAAAADKMINPALTWRDIDDIGSATRLPIVLKGIMTREDAALAVEHGAAGLIVSNHGGRQLDGTLGTLDVLPEVVDAVAGRAEVYLDGGIRRGTDVLKALALGARAVLVGRPVLYGLAIGGTEGAKAVLAHLRMELDRALALVGRPRIADLERTAVQAVSSDGPS
jgi:isopentenyl diphosphate isomerase/L-lactate dehydrogenase-like FMN-dependent dehydrogenase